MPLQPGTTLGSYQITAKIGQGGMGVVYRARDTTLDRDVALKMFPSEIVDPDFLERFQREGASRTPGTCGHRERTLYPRWQ